MPHANPGAHVSCEPAQSKRTWTLHKSQFLWKSPRKLPHTNSGASVLYEPAQAKRRWTFQKSNFFWKFRGKMPEPQLTTSIEHRALTETVRTPSVWPHCLGKKRTCLVSRHGGRQGWIVSQHLSPSICPACTCDAFTWNTVKYF